MEESAKSAADVVGEAVHVTKDKVKEKVAREDERKTELWSIFFDQFLTNLS